MFIGGDGRDSVSAADLFFARMAALWLALEATRVDFARFVGWVPTVFCPLELTAVGEAVLTAPAMAAGAAVWAATVWAATAANERAAVEAVVPEVVPSTAAGDAAGGANVAWGGGCRRCCRLVSLHSLVLSMFLARFLALRRLL